MQDEDDDDLDLFGDETEEEKAAAEKREAEKKKAPKPKVGKWHPLWLSLPRLISAFHFCLSFRPFISASISAFSFHDWVMVCASCEL